MDKYAKLKVTLDPAGSGKVFLNNMDISDCVTSIEFKATSESLTEIKLKIIAEVDAEVTAKLDQIALAKTEPERLPGPRFLKSR